MRFAVAVNDNYRYILTAQLSFGCLGWRDRGRTLNEDVPPRTLRRIERRYVVEPLAREALDFMLFLRARSEREE